MQRGQPVRVSNPWAKTLTTIFCIMGNSFVLQLLLFLFKKESHECVLLGWIPAVRFRSILDQEYPWMWAEDHVRGPIKQGMTRLPTEAPGAMTCTLVVFAGLQLILVALDYLRLLHRSRKSDMGSVSNPSSSRVSAEDWASLWVRSEVT